MEITEQQNEIIENNGGKLTPELAAQLIDQELHGNTANAENGSAPETTQAQDGANTPNAEAQTPQQQPDESQLNAENAVVLAKDGKHTIPFERLADARKGEQEWKQKFEDAQVQLAQLQANAQQRIDNGQAFPQHRELIETVGRYGGSWWQEAGRQQRRQDFSSRR